MKYLLLSLLVSVSVNADCVIMKMTPSAPDSNGCVSWRWEYVPISSTNCAPVRPPSNPLARYNPNIDPSDCLFVNTSGRVINMCSQALR